MNRHIDRVLGEVKFKASAKNIFRCTNIRAVYVIETVLHLWVTFAVSPGGLICLPHIFRETRSIIQI